MTNNSQAASDLMDSAIKSNEIERLQGELAKWISHNGEMERLSAETLDGKKYKDLSYEQRQMANELMNRNRMILDGNGCLYRM